VLWTNHSCSHVQSGSLVFVQCATQQHFASLSRNRSPQTHNTGFSLCIITPQLHRLTQANIMRPNLPQPLFLLFPSLSPSSLSPPFFFRPRFVFFPSPASPSSSSFAITLRSSFVSTILRSSFNFLSRHNCSCTRPSSTSSRRRTNLKSSALIFWRRL
jgi:hypothetical protein